jgi:hypothetical protein
LHFTLRKLSVCRMDSCICTPMPEWLKNVCAHRCRGSPTRQAGMSVHVAMWNARVAGWPNVCVLVHVSESEWVDDRVHNLSRQLCQRASARPRGKSLTRDCRGCGYGAMVCNFFCWGPVGTRLPAHLEAEHRVSQLVGTANRDDAVLLNVAEVTIVHASVVGITAIWHLAWRLRMCVRACVCVCV